MTALQGGEGIISLTWVLALSPVNFVRIYRYRQMALLNFGVDKFDITEEELTASIHYKFEVVFPQPSQYSRHSCIVPDGTPRLSPVDDLPFQSSLVASPFVQGIGQCSGSLSIPSPALP